MTDYIKRDDAIDAIGEAVADGLPKGWYLPLTMIPSADVAPVRHAKWMKDVEGCLFCSNCHNTAEFNPLSMEQFKTPYCNVCGAKMDGGEGSGR